MILYAGDGKTNGAASYLLGVLEHQGFDYQHIASDQTFSEDLLHPEVGVLILSDFPSAHMAPAVQTVVVERVRQGMGLIMLGGWESYHGLGGDWDQSLLAQVLPVEICHQDDRVNCWQPALVRKVGEHPILQDLPWHLPPTIGGFNRFVPKGQTGTAYPDGSQELGTTQGLESPQEGVTNVQTLLVVDQFDVVTKDFDQPEANAYSLRHTDPLLVVGTFGSGTTLAFASDVAPHWIGGTVDWGNERIVSTGKGALQVEIGNWYARFFAGLVEIAGLSS